MQAQVTLRPIHGLSFQTSYTWSKNLGDQSTYTDMRDLSSDYGMLGSNRSHALSSYGTFTLPFGANGFLMKNATGVWKHVAEGWQLSWIFSATSGMPGSLAGTSMLWANGQMDQVGAFDPKSGRVSWDEGDVAGYFYGKNKYMKVVDPQCSAIHSSLQSSCQTRLFAIAEVAGLNSSGLPIAGDMVFQHPQPGTRGNFDVNGLTGMGRWSLDMAMGKTFEFMEGKSIDLRVDAQNIFNHPTPSNSFLVRNARFTILYNPNFSVNNADPFGYISAKGGHRTFQAKLRISF
jgi:hypothetical protein